MDEPVVVALSENLRGAAAERVAAVSPRVRLVYVTPAGAPLDDVSDTEVLFRGGGADAARGASPAAAHAEAALAARDGRGRRR